MGKQPSLFSYYCAFLAGMGEQTIFILLLLRSSYWNGKTNKIYSPLIALVLLEWENKRGLFSIPSAHLAGMGIQPGFNFRFLCSSCRNGKTNNFILPSLRFSCWNGKITKFYPLIIALTRPHRAFQTKTTLMLRKSSFEEKIKKTSLQPKSFPL